MDASTGAGGGADEANDKSFGVAAPQLSLPKGGGAIKGIGEKFSVNPANGTGSLTVPIFTTPGRSKFSPNLSLAYNSGSGNGPFGFGWRLSIPSITRKTDKGLPRYFDAEESDVYILSDAEDLVPALLQAGAGWQKDTLSAVLNGQSYTVQRYRPRIEGLFARIERWWNDATGDIFWRSISKDNIVSIYGPDLSSRIADPRDPSRIFSWLLALTYDDRGNAIVYEYKAEDRVNVPPSLHEEHREVTANRYIKRILYGNLTPYVPNTEPPAPTECCFEVVFDYGEHDREAPSPAGSEHWRCRPDPFSHYRSCFEVRTYRLCSRVLMFHRFIQELGTQAYLVRSTDFRYSCDASPLNTLNPIYTYLESVEQTGHLWQTSSGKYVHSSFPPLEFDYTQPEVDKTLHYAEPASLENLPYGVDGAHYQWVDLDSEGSPGILTQQGDSWFYKRNVSNLPDSGRRVRARFEPLETVATIPSSADLGGGRQQLMDLAGDGQLSLVQFSKPVPGYYERDQEWQWCRFQPFVFSPNIDWRDPNLRTLDLDGDGFADILITQQEVFTWYPSYARAGFGPAGTVRKPFDEDFGPAIIFADGTQSIYLADMSGDGLKDIVRIRNGEICYWPNMGYGRFGAKITMDGSPYFDTPDLFDQKRVRLADIDGSGSTDIIYLGRDKVTFWLNQSGNGWSSPSHIAEFPATNNLDSVSAVDLLGKGTTCLVWSSPLPGDAERPLCYIDLMRQKPHLLIKVRNNLGSETLVHYVASTRFYLEDRRAGQPWVTRLSFPVQVVERVETYDWVSRNRLVTRYTYHHGYYDGHEREFRGFGRVDQYDTDEIGALTQSGSFPKATNIDTASYVPPVLTKTWYHNGAYPMGWQVSRVYDQEYYQEQLSPSQVEAMRLPDTVLPDGLTGREIREAIRSLKGSVLRQEIYSLDGTEQAALPYSVSEKNYTITFVQPFCGNRHAVFFTHARESIDFHYERKLYDVGGNQLADPRVTHNMVLAVDEYGNELQSVAIGYGRRRNSPDPLLTSADQAIQMAVLVTSTESSYTQAILDPTAYRTPLIADAQTFQLINVNPTSDIPNITNLFGFDEMTGYVNQAGDGSHELPFEDVDATGATDSNHPYRRLIGETRTLYLTDDLSAPLPLGVMDSMALTYQSYRFVFTPCLLVDVYEGSIPNQTPASLAAILTNNGGYVLGDSMQSSGLFPISDPEGYWWIPSGQAIYSATNFYLPVSYIDPFGESTLITYDSYNLLVTETQDPLGNMVLAQYDYRVMQPNLITDPNGNQVAAAFDTLGLVAGTAVMGKPGQNVGDSLRGFSADLEQSEIDAFLANPNNPSDTSNPYITPTLLADATTRIVYDLHRFRQTLLANPADPTQWQPVFAATIERETHVSDLPTLPPAQGGASKLQISISYSDGFSREIQKKTQAEPGPRDPNEQSSTILNPRWIGSGWTIFNNKGKPVRKYEPFFSGTQNFEFEAICGVSPILFYDPVNRVVATLYPDQSWEKVVFDPWHQENWDRNDTILIPNATSPNPAQDPDVGLYFERLPRADYLPTWYTQRTASRASSEDQDAAMKTALHANTPSLAYLDTLGRTFLSIADNGPGQQYCTRIALDIQGYQRSITDALNRQVMTYDYDPLGTKLYQNSVDAGERWTINDVQGKPLFLWNSRNFQLQRDYDALRRQIHLYVSQMGAAAPPQLAERTVYGEAHPDALALNLHGKVFLQFDGPGIVTNNSYDFKANLFSSSRQLLECPVTNISQLLNYADQADWSTLEPLLAVSPPNTLDLSAIDAALTPLLESYPCPTQNDPNAQCFMTSTTYDALNRVVTHITPDGSVTVPTYNERGLLQTITVTLAGGPNAGIATPFVSDIEYNPKGQRDLIAYGNGTTTTYTYDLQTFRLASLYTARPAATFPGDDPPNGAQNLTYTYDPVGNTTYIEDNAQQTIYFNNQAVQPINDYTYDPIYRLIEAQGRELIGLGSGPVPVTWDDSIRMNQPVPGPNDGQAVQGYTESYIYDAVGNFQQLIHGTASGNWTRCYFYDSQLPTGDCQTGAIPGNNHLTTSTIGSLVETYGVPDPNGNMLQMPQLTAMAWDFKDQLQMTRQTMVNNGSAPATYYVYDSTGQRARKINQAANGTVTSERIYLGGYEVYREFSGTNISAERQTLHVMDDKQRVALIETLAQGKDGYPPQIFRYQFSNHLGSVLLELDELSAIISYEEYYPYGSTSYQATSSQTETPKRYRYTGKERDEESGLYYHGARYYAPWIGRWTSCDPQGSADGTSVYGYCRSSPLRFTDRTGLAPDPTTPASIDPAAPTPRKFPENRSISIQHSVGKSSSAPSEIRPKPPGNVITDDQKYRMLVENLKVQGLPVGFLETVQRGGYRISADAAFAAFTDLPTWASSKKILHLTPQDLEGWNDAASRGQPSIIGIGTLFHEATHAYFDLMKGNPLYAEVIRKGIDYYRGAPLRGGGTAHDPERIFQEAVATYVEVRAGGYKHAIDFLQSLSLMISSEAPSQEDGMAMLTKIRQDYETSQEGTTFGYQPKWSYYGYDFQRLVGGRAVDSTQVYTTREMPQDLRDFLDRNVLEGRIPHTFSESATLTSLANVIRGQLGLSQ